jgi:predicted PurR-regulated permease PerM
MTTPPPPEPESLPPVAPEPHHPPGSETLAAITALGSALVEAPPPRRVRQIISLVLLSALLLGFAYLFFQVIHTLFLPLFIAAILALVLHPTQQSLSARLGGREGVAALLILLGLLLVLIVPALYLGMFSYETLATGIQKMERAARQPSTRDLAIARIAEALGVPPDRVEARLVQALKDSNAYLFENALKALGNLASALFALFLFLLSLFFFLKDGRRMVAGWENLTPLEPDQDRMIRERFSVVCRAVVVSTFLAALVQTGAFAIGLLVIDHVFGTGLHTWVGFLTLLGAIFAMIPFMGVSVVWVPLCLYWAARGEYWAAGLMAFYGGVVIGQVDNLVRILVLRGTADLHPLVGLISILGGMQYLGVTGVFVGPIIAAVLVSLLRIVKQEIDHLSEIHPESS